MSRMGLVAVFFVWGCGGGTAGGESVPVQIVAESPSAALAQDAELVAATGRYVVKPAAVSGELALYPVVDTQVPARPTGDYDTMAAALERGTLALTEVSSSGTVAVLEARNTGERAVLLLAGDVVTGGKQDRVVVADLVVPAGGEPVRVDVNCVEQGRWATEDGLAFGYGGRGELALKKTVELDKDQSATWSKVAELNENKRAKLDADDLAPSTGTYRASLVSGAVGKERDAMAQAVAAELGRHEDVVGVVIAIDGEIVGAELFGHPTLYARVADDLVRGFALDAVSDAKDDRPGVPGVPEAQRFLESALTAPASSEAVRTGAASRQEFDAPTTTGTVLKEEGKDLLHLNVYKK